jgi:hexosaminidase
VLPQTISISTSARTFRLAAVARQILQAHGVAAALTLSDAARDVSLGGEGYELRVAPSGIAIDANTAAGVYYGLQTLDQLLPYGKQPAPMQGITIRDWPAYRWRGIHLDVSRHFFPVWVVERYIDVAAHYKLNVFHWHLTDDQGWRIQIRRYPRLTSVGGCRAGSEIEGDASEIDGKRYCGFYTQAQIRAVVAYARTRYVTIVPEIEMPGHSQAALAAYPQLGCAPRPLEVRETWGVSQNIYCPTEYTFTFLENVLREVMELFPGPYIHVGGDEVPKASWESSAAVGALMKREHLATYAGVQGYFDRRIEHFLESHGRRMLGWDEILDGGVTHAATIMSWHGEGRGITAAQHGNDAIMTPDGPLYFDAYQGDPEDEPDAIGSLSTPQEVYEYEATPVRLTPSEARHIIGVQGNLWTEFITTPSYLFYMLLPRMLSLSEIAWSDPQPRMWNEFEMRMGAQLPWLTAHGYNFRVPNPELTVSNATMTFSNVSSSVRTIDARTQAASVSVTISTVVPGGTIRYTTDGSVPDVHAREYSAPLHERLEPNQRLDLRAIVVLPDGRASTPSELVVTREGSAAQEQPRL